MRCGYSIGDGRDLPLKGCGGITDRQVYNAFNHLGTQEYIDFVTGDTDLSGAIERLGKKINKAHKRGEQLSSIEEQLYLRMNNSKDKKLTFSIFRKCI